MAMYGGVSNAVKKLYPWGGQGNALKRFLRSKCGVGNAVKTCQLYLDEIDHVEINFDSCASYDKYGGTLYGKTRAILNQHASFSVSGATAYLNCNNGCNYVYFHVYAVLKDGYKVRINYPYSTDSKAVSIKVKGTGSSGSYGIYYPFLWVFGGPEGENIFGTQQYTFTMGSTYGTGYGGGIRDQNTHKNGYTFSDAVIGGVTYSVRCVDAVA